MKRDTKTQNLESMQTETLEMTEAQKKALKRQYARWHKVISVSKAFGTDDAIIVRVQGETGFEMTLGIEPDGYTHS